MIFAVFFHFFLERMQHWYMYRYVSVCESGMIPVQTHALLLLLLLSAWCRNVPPGPSFGRRQGTVVSLVDHAAEANASHDQMIDAPCDPQDAVRIPDPNQLPLDCASVRQILKHIIVFPLSDHTGSDELTSTLATSRISFFKIIILNCLGLSIQYSFSNKNYKAH